MKYKHIYVTIKATLRCNLACQYCYGRDNHAQERQMTDDEICQGLNFICEYATKVGAKSLSLCWHGGEPFILIRRLSKLIEYANRLFGSHDITVEHGTQTNATLLQPDTYYIIKNYFNGYVGVSLDLYSRYRTFSDGKVSTDLVVRNIDNAINAGIRLGAINLITHDNLDHIKEIYEFYKSRRMNVRLARVFPINEGDTLTNPMYVNDEEFAQAMIDYFDLWANDFSPANNTYIMKLIGDLLLGRPSICLRESECHKRYTALSPGGDIYSCAEFDIPKAVIGNFINQTVDEFIASDAREKLSKQALIPEQCHNCRYERICHGGCFRERFMLGYPYRCKSNILYWDYIVKWLEEKGAGLYFLLGKTKEEQQSLINSLFNNK